MPTKPKLRDEFIITFKDFLVEICRGISEAQQLLDEQSLDLLNKFYSDDDYKDLRDNGIEPTWYQIPELNASLKVSISAHNEEEQEGSSPVTNLRPLIKVAPYNAKYKNYFDYDYSGTSSMDLKVVAIPPPVASSQTIVPNVIGKTKDEAVIIFKESKLILGEITETESEEKKGNIISQSPLSGETVRIGHSIDIEISK